MGAEKQKVETERQPGGGGQRKADWKRSSKEKRPESTIHGWVGRRVGWTEWMTCPLLECGQDAAPEKDCEPRLPAQDCQPKRVGRKP